MKLSKFMTNKEIHSMIDMGYIEGLRFISIKLSGKKENANCELKKINSSSWDKFPYLRYAQLSQEVSDIDGYLETILLNLYELSLQEEV